MSLACPRSALALLALLSITAAPAGAVEPTVVHHGRFADFEPGSGHGITLRSDGELRLGPVLTPQTPVAAQRIWALATAADVLWIGTGDDGRIYRHVAGDPEPELILDSPEIGIHALVATADGVLAGTSPDGLVYRVTAAGDVTTVARTGSRYVWALALDRRDRILVAAGGPARVLRLDGGDTDTLFEARGDGHVRSLAGSAGRWFVGTAVASTSAEAGGEPPRARIYEITEDGGRLVVETQAEEVTHLVNLGDTLFAALLTSPAAGASNHGKVGESRATLLRVEPGGAAFPVWAGTGVWAGLLTDAGWLTAVLREPGRVLRLRTDGRLIERVAHIDSLVPNAAVKGGDLVIGDGRSGRLAHLAPSPSDSGHFDGAVIDLGAHGHWGTIDWEAVVPSATGLLLRTRTGNSEVPDITWSDWSPALTDPGRPVPSPASRYLQYRVVMTSRRPDRSPQLRRVSIAARQTNLPPEITEFSTYAYHGVGGANQGQPPPPPNGGRNGRGLPQSKSLRLVRWQASDPNGDQLRYRIYLRGEGQRQWKLVEEDIDETMAVWDTENMPEGITQLRLVASDAPHNPASWALDDDLVSEPFAIDNSPPRVTLETRRDGGVTVIEARVEDTTTAVHGVRYSLDYDDRGQQLAPADGVFDSRRETATLRLEDLAPGEHVVCVQAWDALDNVGVARLILEVE